MNSMLFNNAVPIRHNKET